MVLSFYSGTPFASNYQVTVVDTFTSNGTAGPYVLVNKTISQLAATITAGAVEYYAYNGGFTINSGANSFTLSSAPVAGIQIVAPGVNQVVIAAFDQDTVLGVTSPRTQSVPVWIIDPDTINNFKYEPLPTYPGLQISVVQLITGSNAQPSWIQFASADASGNALTFGATGAPLYLPAIDGFCTLTASSSSSQITLLISATAGFYSGCYASIDVGTVTQEVVHVISVGASSLNIDPTGTTYAHSASSLVFNAGYKFWIQGTIPLNANSNTPVNLYNLGLQRLGAIRARP